MASPSSPPPPQPPPPPTNPILLSPPQPQPQQLRPKPEPESEPESNPNSLPLALPLPQPQPQPYSDPPMATPIPLLIAAPPTVAVRRLPPPCWTPEETSALIDAYRDKWYSLRRSNLRAAHWEEVAEDVHTRCPHASPPKTAVQCRHKMEKLRKRYRNELQRAGSIPHHRFSSSWVYFHKMESMEKGPNPAASPPSATAVSASVIVNSSSDEDDDDEDFQIYHKNGIRMKGPGNPNPKPNPNYGFRSRYANINSFNSPPPPSLQFEEASGSYGRVGGRSGSNGSAGSSGFNVCMNMSMGMGSMATRKEKRKSRLGKRERDSGGGDDVALEMVEAIRMMGEGFVRMERMKMEMVRETERMRMDMEMKRTQMILDSQHRIVEAFAKGLAESMNITKDDAS